jgi:acetyl-CoA C-acetyltransferase
MAVSIPQNGAELIPFSQDECPRESSYKSLARLKPVFKEGGVTTPGNSSIISDGAAAVVVMAREKAEAMGCQIMATIGAQASAGIDAKYLLVGPILGIPKCLAKEGIRQEDVDLFEIKTRPSAVQLWQS